MDTLSAMKVFCSVVESNSLAGAARMINVSPSVVSKQLSALEDRLGARLINRTTRRVSVTEEGRAYYERSKQIIADIDEAEIAVSHAHTAPQGLLKITAPFTFAHRHLTPHLPEFIRIYPNIEIQVQVSDRVVDLVDEGLDLAIRIAHLKDSSLIARRLAANHRSIVATPTYLEMHGIPQHPEELSGHKLVTWPPGNPINDWHFLINDQERTFKAKGLIYIDSGDSILSTVLAGGGLSMLQAFMVGEYIKNKQLIPVLEDFVREDIPIFAVYPSSRHLSPKVRVFVDFLLKKYGPQPYWITK
ncbi:MAG: transcriptional regulator [Rhodospirillaceae bacterium]|nr:transcriptional regulator [Rhodospirillaceae bacterium]|tara:strand:- start:522 stop:1427 length:906 start_codon:yes stop_codon:yes gene_type:complete